MKIKAKNGEDYYIVDVIAQILKHLKIELIEKHLKRGGHPLEATDFDWVITVPAIWKSRGKQMMREAGYKVTRTSNHVNNLILICGMHISVWNKFVWNYLIATPQDVDTLQEKGFM